MTGDEPVEAAVDEVGDLLDARIGLRPQSTLRGRLRRCIRDEVIGYGDDIESYVERLSRSGALMESLVNRVTVQESAFFRHPDHFDVLAHSIFPALASPVTIWSAGCANGQEAYSLAMLLEEHAVDGSVLATDLSTSALARTAAATYNTREIAGVSIGRRARHFNRGRGDDWTVKASLRSRVATQQHNLLDELPAPVAGCQVVFCRNVLIYFSPEHSAAFLDKVAAALSPGAYLFLGSAESLWQVTDRFEAVRLGDSFVYRRRDEPADRPRKGAAATRAAMGSLALPPRAGRDQPASRHVIHPARSPARTEPARSLTRKEPAGSPIRAEPARIAETEVLARTGRLAFESGDHAAAVVAFRKWAYLAPDEPLATLHLALALEAGGHVASAQRAYDVARAAVLRGGTIEENALGGYAPDELVRLLNSKQVRDS